MKLFKVVIIGLFGIGVVFLILAVCGILDFMKYPQLLESEGAIKECAMNFTYAFMYVVIAMGLKTGNQ